MKIISLIRKKNSLQQIKTSTERERERSIFNSLLFWEYTQKQKNMEMIWKNENAKISHRHEN